MTAATISIVLTPWRSRVRRRPNRNEQRERRALPELRLDVDPPTEHCGEPLGDEEPEARAAVAARQPRLELRERLEKPGAVARPDADPGILDAERHAVVRRRHVERHAPHIGELDRVPDEIHEDLAELVRVTHDLHAGG